MSRPNSLRELRRLGVWPPVRATRNQAEVALLPPYGDPEVNVLGEFVTYALACAAATSLLRRLRGD